MGNAPSKGPAQVEGRFFQPIEHPPLRVLEDKAVQTVVSYQKRSKLKWWKHLLLGCVVAYMAALFCLLFLPWTQGLLLYLHWVKWPYHFKYTDLHTLAMPNARNIQIRTADGETLYGYHLLPAGELSVNISNLPEPQREQQFDLSLQRPEYPVFIFMHGNGATRAFFRRVETIKALSAHMSAHVITFDYRGFAESTGWPSAEGLMNDARAVMRWLEQRLGKRAAVPRNEEACISHVPVFLYGQSLGTGVVTKLAQEMSDSLRPPMGLILDAPYSSIAQAALSHPSAMMFRLPYIRELLVQSLFEDFTSIDVISNVTCPILLMHGVKDFMIPVHHSRALYSTAITARKRLQADRSTGHGAEGSDAETAAFPPSIAPSYVRLVEFSEGGHSDLYAFSQWMSEVATFRELASRVSTSDHKFSCHGGAACPAVQSGAECTISRN